MPLEFVPYAEVRRRLEGTPAHLLLGNGFSIGCDPIFRYGSLYAVACERGLSARAQEVFAKLGTNNFEGVLRSLEDATWIGGLYGLSDVGVEGLKADAEIVKAALVDAVAHSHLEHTGVVSDEKKAAARAFLRPYESIFTTNYDLLLYWVVMSEPERPRFQDGFRPMDMEPGDDSAPLIFSERLGSTPGVYYLHGALHLFMSGSNLCKRSWTREGQRLTDLIRTGLAANEYPLFVAEGTASKKREQIEGHGYLWYCLDKFARIERPLVVFGHSLGASDQHLADAISGNRKLKQVFIGIYGGIDSAPAQAVATTAERMIARREALRNRRGRGVADLGITLFDAGSANTWGQQIPRRSFPA